MILRTPVYTEQQHFIRLMLLAVRGKRKTSATCFVTSADALLLMNKN